MFTGKMEAFMMITSARCHLHSYHHMSPRLNQLTSFDLPRSYLFGSPHSAPTKHIGSMQHPALIQSTGNTAKLGSAIDDCFTAYDHASFYKRANVSKAEIFGLVVLDSEVCRWCGDFPPKGEICPRCGNEGLV